MSAALLPAGWRLAQSGLHASLPQSRVRPLAMLAAVALGLIWFVRFLMGIQGPKPILIVVEVSILLVGVAWGGIRRLRQPTQLSFANGSFRCMNLGPRQEVQIPLSELVRFSSQPAADRHDRPHLTASTRSGEQLRLPLHFAGGERGLAAAAAVAEALNAMHKQAVLATAPPVGSPIP